MIGCFQIMHGKTNFIFLLLQIPIQSLQKMVYLKVPLRFIQKLFPIIIHSTPGVDVGQVPTTPIYLS